ncbi:hypothetical protein K469DRAFT_756166 [Zopfia rhizophila CBS 207.26]|uniref:Peptidase S54 rhomboid domain-containing protein n=1 Tax=Zopfia rhizophila CBS 207.26 TaxID=1314779 RepID=A0A6A6DB79_9PEZI|nr:hypothetical protein K469DRAFT_756166 [Zopfia rhizophila CBS 207.26]
MLSFLHRPAVRSRGLSSAFSPVFRTTPAPTYRPLVRRPLSYSWTPRTHKINNRILKAVIGLNVGVYIYSFYTKEEARQGQPSRYIDYFQNFTLGLDTIREGRWWTMLTCNYAHSNLIHLGCNMFSMHFVGSLIAETPGVTPVRFLILILGSGLCGSIGYIAHQVSGVSAPGSDHRIRRGLGFSGVVTGFVAASACLWPSQGVAVFGIIPMPLWLLAIGYVAYDGYYLDHRREGNTNVAHAGHLGGMAFGLVYYLLSLRRNRAVIWKAMKTNKSLGY